MSENQELQVKTARDELAAVYAELESRDAAPAPEPVAAEPAEYSGEETEAAAPETEAQKAERLRNERGQFAKEPEKPAAKTAQAAEKPAAKAETKPDIPPPVGWKGDAKVDWKRLPASVRQELVNDYTERQALQQRATQFDQVLTPERRQALQMAYGDETRGLQQILATVEYSNKNPKEFLTWYAQTRGINLAELVAPQQQEATYVDPALQQVTSQLTGLQQQVVQTQQYLQQQQQQQLYNRATSEYQAFMSDVEKHPYANDVYDQMMELVSKKLANSLEDAYDKAVYLNPQVRAKMISAQQQNMLQSQAQNAANKRQAAVSVAGAPGGVANSQMAIPMINGRPETATETVRRTFQEMGARF